MVFEGIKRIVEMEKEKPRERNDFVSSEKEWFLDIYEERVCVCWVLVGVDSVDKVKQCNRTTEILSADECENGLRLKEGKVLEDDVRVRGKFKQLKYIFICGNI